MLKKIKDLFIPDNIRKQTESHSEEYKLQIAACALLLEIATADDNLNKEEKNKINFLMKKTFNLSDEEVSSLIEKSEEEIENSVSLYEFTDIINNNLNNDEKYRILKYLWCIAYADGNIDSYEDYYIKKISNNLHMHHKDRIAAKMEVKIEIEKNN
jgi:uncharacterized tellurite resistance protein B-like protein